MDPVHDRGSMDPVHDSGPWTRSKVGFMDPWSMFCPHPWRTIMGGRGVRGFSWKRLCLCGQLVTRKGPKQLSFVPYLKYLNFKIFNIGVRL